MRNGLNQASFVQFDELIVMCDWIVIVYLVNSI